PIDLRCGIDRLLLQVQSMLGRDACDGGAYVFRNRSGTRIKVLCVDAQGVWLSVRRLHQGRFVWPRVEGGVVHLTTAQLSMLLEGIDWRRPQRTARPRHAA
ncbi:MAG: IS66 family insertion sequence element accessory protein TnpB, partial [Gammaproteobacteria bacterium]